ncbi:50S ribosomal protein L21e [Candidatus Woesearchaeota archaeon]|nr:50S ribosomal protein L21e [Candidatus Woesearchaeota archaeon]
MATRAGGFRRKTRFKLQKNIRDKGKTSLRNYLQTFEVGEKVTLKAEPAIQKGMHFPRFNGKTGVITCKKGTCYEVSIKDGKKEKPLIVHPVHLRG